MSQITDTIASLINFQNKLKALEHYPTNYADIDDLKYKFGEQLIKVLPKLTGISQNNIDKLSNQKYQDAANIVQNFYGNVGNVAREQNLTDANIQSDRNTMNQSRNVNISGNAKVNASGAGAFNLLGAAQLAAHQPLQMKETRNWWPGMEVQYIYKCPDS